MRHKTINTAAVVYMDLDREDLVRAMQTAHERWEEKGGE